MVTKTLEALEESLHDRQRAEFQRFLEDDGCVSLIVQLPAGESYWNKKVIDRNSRVATEAEYLAYYKTVQDGRRADDAKISHQPAVVQLIKGRAYRQKTTGTLYEALDADDREEAFFHPIRDGKVDRRSTERLSLTELEGPVEAATGKDEATTASGAAPVVDGEVARLSKTGNEGQIEDPDADNEEEPTSGKKYFTRWGKVSHLSTNPYNPPSQIAQDFAG